MVPLKLNDILVIAPPLLEMCELCQGLLKKLLISLSVKLSFV